MSYRAIVWAEFIRNSGIMQWITLCESEIAYDEYLRQEAWSTRNPEDE